MTFVTQSNWKAALAEAKAHIEEAAFVAVDLELSGVQTTPWRAANQVDTLDTRYLNLRDSAHKFGLLQFGLCPFLWDPALSKFVPHPYSFLLFPRDELPIEMPARDFLCQATSLQFLAKHKFDFNACIYDGITYLSREQERLARIQLAKWRLDDADRPEIALSKTGDVLFCESVRVQVGEWRDKVLQKEKDSDDNLARPCLMVEISGSYQANLVHQVLRKSFQDLVSLTQEGKKQVKVIFPKSTKEKAALLLQWEKEKGEQLEAQLMNAVGFRHLVDAIVESGKPLVGHNCFLDFAHVYSKFFADLPLNCKEFCSSIRQYFRCILDTKYLLKSVSSIKETLGNGSTTLGCVYARLEASVDKTVELSSSEMLRYDGKDMKHEAGYDAYMTGVIFANMCKIAKVDPTSLSSIESTALGSYANVFYLGWPSEMALDLSSGKEATGTKSLKTNNRWERTVIVWRCEDGKKDEADIEKSIGSCFSRKTDVEVLSIDEGSAFVVFRKKESVELFVRAFDEHGVGAAAGSCNVKGMVDRGFKVVRFEAFERVCRSPLSTLKLADALEVVTANNPESSPSKKRLRL